MNELKSEINGVVIEKIAVRESVGNTHLKLRLAKDVRKVHVGKSICQLVEVGDSIYKSKFSNCLFIIRDSTIIETTFRDLHDKTINSSYFNSEQFDLNCF